MAVQHNGMSSTFDLMPSTVPKEDPEKAQRQHARERAQKSADAELGRGSKTPEELAILKVLRSDGPVVSAEDLRRATGLGASATSQALSGLIGRGLVQRSEGSMGTGRRISAV